ncbi:MAG: glycosyltransferase family 2 protein [Lachnospiraceae bacterium]|nr:glycosyltransferase family 2 protein [Lachnospiraceae bacterium]
MDAKFNRERVRFHTKKPNTLVVQGWFEGDELGQEQFEARMGGKRLPLDVIVQRGPEVTKKYLRYKTNVSAEYFLVITLPGSTEADLNGKALRIWHRTGEDKHRTGDAPEQKAPVLVCAGGVPEQKKPALMCADDDSEQNGSTPENGSGRKKQILCLGARRIRQLSGHLESWMETLRELPDGRYQLRGWYMGCDHAAIALLDKKGKEIPFTAAPGKRIDILGEFPEAGLEETHGFELVFHKPEENILRLVLSGDGKKTRYTVNCAKMLSGREGFVNICRKSWRYLRRKGYRQFVKRVSDVLMGNEGVGYERWRRKYGVKRQELTEQRSAHFAWEPKISIVVPLYRTPEKFLREMITSVQMQTWSNWELVLSDGSGNAALTGLLKKYEASDSRILVLLNDGNPLRIAENTNAALMAATGDYIVFGDHDDLFSPDALWSCVKVLNEKPDTELIYSDEDKIDVGGRRYFEPHFKPDYSPDLLCSMNYFCHLVLIKRELRERTGFLDPAYDGAQDYDYVLRCTENTDASRIAHIPKILYHWRSHKDSTAENPESKRYAFEAGRRAIAAHYERLGLTANVTEGEYPGLYHTEFAIQEREDGSLPLISILIPNKDHIVDLRNCIRSIEEKSDYRNYEYIIIENNSTEPETFEAYRELERDIPRLRVVYFKTESDTGFNFSAINNFGTNYAKGDYYLLLNNDTEIINPDCLRQMLGYCQREEVGAVGALLFYEDGTIQHAGVVLGYGGIAGHAFIGEKRGDNGYFSRIICAQNYSAVTAACMMVKASVYHEAGGMSEELCVAFNDIDFCMKVRQLGKLIVYTPQAQLYHYESKSRGLENTQEKIERFNQETRLFLERWGDQVKAGDPYYNPNLALDKADFSIRM